MEAWDISEQRIPRSFHLRPFIVLTITKRAHYKVERETTCSVNVLKLVSTSQPEKVWVRLGLGLGLGGDKFPQDS